MRDNLSTTSSERRGVRAGEPLSSCGSIITDDADHFVHLWAHLDAAGQSTVRSLGTVGALHSILLKGESLVQLLIPGIWDYN